MAAAKQTKWEKNFLKTDKEIEAELLSVQGQQTQNDLQQAILSTRSKALEAQGEVKKKEISLQQTELNLESAKGAKSSSFGSSNSYGKNLVDAYYKTEQAKADVETAKENLKNVNDLLTFLQSTESEWFSN